MTWEVLQRLSPGKSLEELEKANPRLVGAFEISENPCSDVLSGPKASCGGLDPRVET